MRIDDLLEQSDHVLRLRDHPRQARTIQRAAKAGIVVPVLPGVYVATGEQSRPGIRIRAACAWCPQGVIHGQTAAELYLRRRISTPIRLRAPRTPAVGAEWLQVSVARVPESRAGAGVRVVWAAHCAVELAAHDDGEVILEMLRRRIVTVAQLTAALAEFRGSPGQPRRARVVAAVADNPWSYAELRLQRLLRARGITGWVANRSLWIRGNLVYPDVRFDRERLVVEFDGEAVHSTHEQFEEDRRRQNLLVLAGYRVLRITWAMLERQPDLVASTIETALRRTPVAISGPDDYWEPDFAE